jgi:hypothetical protein
VAIRPHGGVSRIESARESRNEALASWIACRRDGIFCHKLRASAPDFRVIQWDFTRICQIYDFGWGGRPIPSNYRILTPPLPSFRAAVRAKGQLARHGRCSI